MGHHFTGTTTSKPQMEEPVVDPALAAAPAEIPIAKAESVAREVGQAIPFWEPTQVLEAP